MTKLARRKHSQEIHLRRTCTELMLSHRDHRVSTSTHTSYLAKIVKDPPHRLGWVTAAAVRGLRECAL